MNGTIKDREVFVQCQEPVFKGMWYSPLCQDPIVHSDLYRYGLKSIVMITPLSLSYHVVMYYPHVFLFSLIGILDKQFRWRFAPVKNNVEILISYHGVNT